MDKIKYEMSESEEMIMKYLWASQEGRCFNEITKQYGDIDLYSPDLSHQSYIGSCVAAICHYKTVFGEMPATCASLELDAGVYQKISPIIKDSI